MSNDYPMNLGVIPDDRTPEQKAKDWNSKEVVAMASPIDWKPLDLSKIKVLFPKNQLQRSSCVAQTIATMKSRKIYREDGDILDVSPTPVYAQRSNKPDLGMRYEDAIKYTTKEGPSIEAICPSEGLSEGGMNEALITNFDTRIGQAMASIGLFRIDPPTIDDVARIMESDRRRGMALPIMLWFRFPINGAWWRQVPNDSIPSNGSLTGHSVCGIEYGIYEGQKAIVIQESAGVSSTIEPNKKNLRVITEDYFKNHIDLAAYETASSRPRYTFKVALEFDMSVSKPDVIALQNILKYEGLLDKAIQSTGYYGGLTAKAVEAFQIKYGVPTDGLGGRRVGPKTLAVLNQKYGN